MKEREAYEGLVAGLRKEVYEALNQTLKRVYGAFDQATNLLEALCSNIHVPCLQLDPNKVVRDRF